MTALANPKHERFAQGLAKGSTQLAAYTAAGYKPDDGAANRLSGDVRIKARVEELLERSAVRVEISVASVTEALLRIACKAERLADAPGMSVARAAQMDAAKLNGLIVDKSQNENTNTVRVLSDKPLTDEEWAVEHGADLGAATGAAESAH